jgi:hypothetical protein
MQWLLLLWGLAAVLYLFVRWSLRVGPAHTAQVLRWTAVTIGAVLLLLLFARGGAALAVPLLAVLPVLLKRWQQLWRPLAGTRSAASSSSPGPDKRHPNSTVETRFLRMTLQHASGVMEGTVLIGRFSGRLLRQLTLEELLTLWQECQVDPQSAAVLEAYLDRTQGQDWREYRHHRQESTSHTTAMDRQEAYEVLGLPPGATVEAIKAAHRRLMQRVHPDHGGSNYLAARINQAKAVLLNETLHNRNGEA